MAKSALGPTALGLILESRVDMGCDTDFAMYYSLFKTAVNGRQRKRMRQKLLIKSSEIGAVKVGDRLIR